MNDAVWGLDEELILTGDENIVDINFVVLWQIKDAGQYLFNGCTDIPLVLKPTGFFLLGITSR